MPTELLGYTRNELVQIVMDMVGSSSTRLLGHLRQNITAWQYEFCNMHDWSFAHNNSFAATSPILSSVIGQPTYTLGTSGDIMWTGNIESVVCITLGAPRKLIKESTENIRTADPGNISNGQPSFWVPINMNTIQLWPTPVVVEQFRIDGKFEPNFISGTASDYTLFIPYKFQDCFLQYVFVNALRYERDPRRDSEMKYFEMKVRIALTEDGRNLDSNLRVKTVNEQFSASTNADINTRLWNYGE